MDTQYSRVVDLSENGPGTDPLVQIPFTTRPHKVLISHGKSSYSQLCSLVDLIASNKNLKRVKQGLDPEKHLIPLDGNLDELCGKILYVSRPKRVSGGEQSPF